MNKSNPPLIRLAHPLAFAAFLEELGAPVGSYFRQHSLPTLCNDPNVFVPLGRAWGLFGDAARHEGADLAWHVGKYIGDKSLSAGLSDHFRTAPTLYKALQTMSRLISSESSHLRMGLIEGRDHVLFYTSGYFNLKDEHGFSGSQAYQLEVLTAFIRHFTGTDWVPPRLGFCGSTVPEVVEAHFPDCRICIEQPFSYIAISRSDLHLKSVVSPDARIEPAALLLTAELNFAETLALLIKPYLSEGYPSLRFAASLADTSVRTLLRRLSECGTSYQALIDELRFKLARDLLLESDTLIGDIAVATGIRDKGNFARMFRRVGGLSPREFRKAQNETQSKRR